MKISFSISNYTKLLRIGQWYKNALIFLPLLFAMPGEVHTLPLLIIGFFCFCSVSSITYMINDWVDREADKLHPTKKNRPLASGKVSGRTAVIVGVILTLIVLLGALHLGLFYAAIVCTYFVATNAYSFGLKNIPVVDSILIAGNFTLRTLAGMTILPGESSLHYFIGVFAIIFIFLTHKRRSDIKLLGAKAMSHKPVLRFYTKRNSYFIRLLGYVGVFYTAYVFAAHGTPIQNLAAAIGLLALTSFLFSKNPKLALNPHHLLKNWMWDLGVVIFVVLMIVA